MGFPKLNTLIEKDVLKGLKMLVLMYFFELPLDS